MVSKRYRNQWRLQYPWAYKVQVGQKGVVKCEYCVHFRKENMYAKEGSLVMQLSALKSHSKSEQHQNAKRCYQALQAREINLMREGINALHDQSREKIITLLKCVYFCSCFNIPQ